MKKILTLAAGALIGLSASLPAEAATTTCYKKAGTAIQSQADFVNEGKYFIYAYSKGVGRFVHPSGDANDSFLAAKGLAEIPETGTTDASYVYTITKNDDGTFNITTNSGLTFPTDGDTKVGMGNLRKSDAIDTNAVAARYNLTELAESEKPTDFADPLFFVAPDGVMCNYNGNIAQTYLCTNADNNSDANTHHLGQWSGTGSVSGIESHFTALAFYPVTEEVPSTIQLTVNYTIDDVVYSSTVINGLEGSSYTISEFPPFTASLISEPITGTFSSLVTSINVPVTVVLPFKYSETEDWNNLTWQAIEPRGSEAPYKWTYTEDGTITDTQVAHASATGYSDAQLWAFIGNLIDGFKIVNKAAGQGKYVTYSDGIGKVIEQTEPSLWMAKPTTAYSEVNKFVCFQTKGGTDYLNHNSGNHKFTSYWVADQGSSNEFFAPADPLIGYYDSNFRDNTVGFSTATESLQAAVTAAEAERYNTATAAALASELAKDYEQIVFDPAKWYRLENVAHPNTYLFAGSDDNRNIWGGETSERTNPYSIVKFEAVPEQTDRYYIADQGLYFGHVTGTASNGNDVMQVEATGERGEFTITTLGAGKHAFRDATSTSEEYYRYLHYAQHLNKKVVGWGSGDVKSQWYIHPANDLVMTLSMQFDGKYIGTGYFPFPVKATDSAKLYYVTESKSKTDNTPVMTYNEVSSVPAATAFIVMSESATATLAIDYDGISALAEPENKLAGTYRAATVNAGDYVFNGTAFEKSTDAPAISGNSAYVPKEAVSNQELSSYPLVSPAEATGISEIGVATSGKQVIYDLQGRRVQRATKGLYIINGVKTLVK